MKPEDIMCEAMIGGKCSCLRIQAEKQKNDPAGLKEVISEKFDALHARINDLEKQIKDLQFDNDVRNGKVV